MKKPVGPLGWTAEEVAEALAEAQKLAEAETLPLGEALLRLWAGREKPTRPGPKSKDDEYFFLALECLKEKKGVERAARGLFVSRVRRKNPMTPESASKQFTRAIEQVRALKLTFFERDGRTN